MAKEKRTDWVVLGRSIGDATGWDDIGDHNIILYDFRPNVTIDLPAGDLAVIFDRGVFETYDDAGEVTFTTDIVSTLGGVERTPA